MNNLLDSCVFIHNLNSGSAILLISQQCASINDVVSISDEILNELKPASTMSADRRLDATALFNTVDNAIRSEFLCLICINSYSQFKKNLDIIREAYYGWMTKPQYLEILIQKGEITRDEIKTFKYRDMGECSLLAIAMTDPKKYVIVTNDKGKVYRQPHINLFDEYAEPRGISVMSFTNWVDSLNC